MKSAELRAMIIRLAREAPPDAVALSVGSALAVALADLWLAVERRQETRCWSRGPRTRDPECLCSTGYQPVCPCTAADVAVTAAAKALEALP